MQKYEVTFTITVEIEANDEVQAIDEMRDLYFSESTHGNELSLEGHFDASEIKSWR